MLYFLLVPVVQNMPCKGIVIEQFYVKRILFH